jgi:hypothetical protein
MPNEGTRQLLMQVTVPSDFSGSTGAVLYCAGHTRATSGDGDWRDGEAVQIPHSLLREAFNHFKETGEPQEIYWLAERRATA